MKRMQRVKSLWITALLMLSVVLTACGGGGGGGETPAVPADLTPPAVTLTSVASPTALTSQLLSGTVEAGASVRLTLTPAGTAGSATVTGGTWTYTLSGLQAGSNTLSIVATDAAGNSSAPLTATIVLDTQAPVLSLSPVAARSNVGNLLLSGSVNETSVVEVAYTGPGAALGAVTYTATTWEVAVTGLAQGSHDFSISGTDGVGNTSAIILATVVHDSVAPTVLPGQKTPADGATDVSLLAPLSFVFSEEMDASSVNITTVQVVDGLGDVPGDLSTVDGKMFVFTPSSSYDIDSVVQVTINAGVSDLAGNPMAAPVPWSFRTANAPPPPPVF